MRITLANKGDRGRRSIGARGSEFLGKRTQRRRARLGGSLGNESGLKMRTDPSHRPFLEIFNEVDEADPLDREKSVEPRAEILLKMLLENALDFRIERGQQRLCTITQLVANTLASRYEGHLSIRDCTASSADK